MKPQISLNNVSKQYTLRRHKATTLKEMIIKGLLQSDEKSDFQALRGIDLTVKPGETLAVIGSNGSGKSTLLNIVAGITQPTAGECVVRGQVAPLIELGVGFNDEFTGMENIFLNGMLLGMTRNEIMKKCDDIIDFAELRRFIYTPIHTYSSGMQMRLGFSVAIHSDADIYLCDEILTVGDNVFREKCRLALHRLKESGKTILLVTHDMGIAEELADRMIWIEDGIIIEEGPAADVLTRFNSSFFERKVEQTPFINYDEKAAVEQDHVRMGNKKAIIENIRLLDAKGDQTWRFHSGDDLTIEMQIDCREPIETLDCHIGIHHDPILIYTLIRSSGQGVTWGPLKAGHHTLRTTLSNTPLAPADYSLSLAITPVPHPDDPYDMQLRIYSFRVVPREDGLPPATAPLQLPIKSKTVERGN